MSVNIPLDNLVIRLAEMRKETLDACCVLMHPRYFEFGALGVTFPLEWSDVTPTGHRDFVSWGIREVKQTYPNFLIEEPKIHCKPGRKGDNVAHWQITGKTYRDLSCYTDNRRYVPGFKVARVIAIRRDAKEKLDIPALALKFNHKIETIEKVLFLRCTDSVDAIEPPLKTPFGKLNY